MKKRTGPKPNQKRRKEVVKMRELGMTFTAIGKKIIPPMSRQGARMLYLKAKGLFRLK